MLIPFETIRADEKKLKQTIRKLLSNAIKFTPDGGNVSVVVKMTTQADIENADCINDAVISGYTYTTDNTSEGSANGVIEFRIVDTGIDLVAEDFERNFNVFEQMDSSTSSEFEGTGLGLTLTRKLVELHHGKIWAESDGKGTGSCFCFFIPLSHK